MPARLYKHLNHEPPDWVSHESDYFITVCAEPRKENHFCKPDRAKPVLSSIEYYHDRCRWYCHLAVVMPDHIHLLVSFPPDQLLHQIIGLWKRGLSRTHKVMWQRGFFDHRVRNAHNMQEKYDYLLQNPVRAGLVERTEDWPHFWRPNE